MMDIRAALEKLCAAGAPSGFERPAVLCARELLEPLVDEVWIDRLGSLVGVRRCGKPNARKLLLDAHLDEIGLIVTGYENGFLRFQAIGGVDLRMLPDRELTVLTDPPLLGVVACLPPHVLSKEDREKAQTIEDFYVDIGLSDDEAKKRVPIGTPMVYRSAFTVLVEDQLCGKAMDDRACFVALLRALELLRDKELDVDLFILGSTMEETTSAGAVTGTQAIWPDWCVAVDTTHGRTPDSTKGETFLLGGGPTVGIGPNMTRWMTRRLFDKAEKEGIPVQKEVMERSSGTNGWEMQICNEGVATVVVSLPIKYMHTPIETLAEGDIERTARLLSAFALDIGKEGGPTW